LPCIPSPTGRKHIGGCGERELLMSAIPTIDPNVKHVGVSKLRDFNASKLKETEDTYVIQENEVPLAVLLRYEKFLIMQEQIQSMFNTVELFQETAELDGVRAGLRQFNEGKTRKLSEIDPAFKRK